MELNVRSPSTIHTVKGGGIQFWHKYSYALYYALKTL
jgi:hypothetical protein